MTSRVVLAVRRANAQKRIEALLPPDAIEGFAKRPVEREIAVMEYVADALEKRAAKAKAKSSEDQESAEAKAQRIAREDAKIREMGEKPLGTAKESEKPSDVKKDAVKSEDKPKS